ncbi:MAG: hypothetical protein Tsb0021_02550 [Chlamydiales bacterium]
MYPTAWSKALRLSSCVICDILVSFLNWNRSIGYEEEYIIGRFSKTAFLINSIMSKLINKL